MDFPSELGGTIARKTGDANGDTAPLGELVDGQLREDGLGADDIDHRGRWTSLLCLVDFSCALL